MGGIVSEFLTRPRDSSCALPLRLHEAARANGTQCGDVVPGFVNWWVRGPPAVRSPSRSDLPATCFPAGRWAERTMCATGDLLIRRPGRVGTARAGQG